MLCHDSSFLRRDRALRLFRFPLPLPGCPAWRIRGGIGTKITIILYLSTLSACKNESRLPSKEDGLRPKIKKTDLIKLIYM